MSIGTPGLGGSDRRQAVRHMAVAAMAAFSLGLDTSGLACSEPPVGTGDRELTPGTVALLVETAGSPAAQLLLTAALSSPDDEVRAVAARVARATHSVAQQSALDRALAQPVPGISQREIGDALDVLRGARPRTDIDAGPGASLSDTAAATAPPPRDDAIGVRIWPWMSPSLGRDLLRVTGCALPKNAPFMVATVDYRPDGTVNHGTLEGGTLSPACKRVGQVLARMTVAPPNHVIKAGVVEAVVMAFASDYLTCVEEGFSPPERGLLGEPVRVSQGKIKAPRRIAHANPEYPRSAQEQGVQGVVVLEAVITPKGCVSEVEVLRSVHPHLDFAALRAVLDWRYAPTILDGRAVPVVMTVTVNFTLQP